MNKAANAVDCQEYLAGIFLDLSKAFDTLDHAILLSKLEACNITGTAHQWITDYFRNTIQYVQIDDSKSDALRQICGVPQGSSSNELEFILFADDTSIFFEHSDLDVLTSHLNDQLHNVSTWLKANKLSINAKKTKLMIFRPSQTLPITRQIIIENNVLEQVDNTTFLGVYIDQYFTWKTHVNFIAAKLSNSVGLLYKAKYYLPSKSLLTGSGRGGPDPGFPPLFRENPASRTFFMSFSNPAFLSQKNTLKSLISTKANKCKM